MTRLGLWIWFLAALFLLYEFFLRAFLGTIVQEIQTAFQINPAQLSLIYIAYPIAYGLMQIPVGILIDRYGVKLLLTIATFLCALGVLFFAISPNFYFAILSRVLMGLGSAFAFVGLLVISLNWLPQRFMGFFFGLAQLFGALGPMLAGAPLAIALNQTHDNWRYLLILFSILGLLLALLILFFVQNKPKSIPNASKLFANTQQFTAEVKQLFRNKQVFWIIAYSGLNYASLALLGALWGTTYLETRGFHHATAAFITSMLWIGLAVGCPLFGMIADYTKRRKIILIGCALLGILTTLLIAYAPQDNFSLFMIAFFGLGMAGAGQNTAFIMMTELVAPKIRATALGLNNAIISLANIILIPSATFLIQLSFHGHFIKGVGTYHQNNFTFVLATLPIIYLMTLLMALFYVRETYQDASSLQPSFFIFASPTEEPEPFVISL